MLSLLGPFLLLFSLFIARLDWHSNIRLSLLLSSLFRFSLFLSRIMNNWFPNLWPRLILSCRVIKLGFCSGIVYPLVSIMLFWLLIGLSSIELRLKLIFSSLILIKLLHLSLLLKLFARELLLLHFPIVFELFASICFLLFSSDCLKLTVGHFLGLLTFLILAILLFDPVFLLTLVGLVSRRSAILIALYHQVFDSLCNCKPILDSHYTVLLESLAYNPPAE